MIYQQIESVVLTNNEKQRLRIYAVENAATPEFCIGVDGDGQDHFSFSANDSKAIINAIIDIVGNGDKR